MKLARIFPFAVLLDVSSYSRASDVSIHSGSVFGKLDNAVAKAKAAIEAVLAKGGVALQGERRLVSSSSCDCSQAALLEITTSFQDVLDHVPLTLLNRLEDFNGTISNSLGLSYNPASDFEMILMPALQSLLQCASDLLGGIECGPCNDDDGDDETSFSSNNASISHFECCCDVNSIRDIVIEQMYSLAEIVNLNFGASPFIEISVDAVTRTTKEIIGNIARPHYACPCFTLDDLVEAVESDPTGIFDFCSFNPDLRTFVDLDVEPDNSGFSVCVGTDCVTDEDPGALRCHGGDAFYNDPKFTWFNGTIEEEVNLGEETACIEIINTFCTLAGDPPPATGASAAEGENDTSRGRDGVET